jgi:DNA polymerase-3 subunit gamma/tau
MLTKEAWNALLKTLEEPPEYVVFILATTEQDKILDTILSRCQVFTFRAPTREELKATILDVAQAEGYALSDAGADVIALGANGSYRDALSIMQKVIMASGDKKLDGDEIALIVGAPRAVLMTSFIDALEEGKVDEAIKVLRELETLRVDIRLFHSMLLERIRAIMLMRHKAMTESDLTSFMPSERECILRSAKNSKSRINSALLQRLLQAGDTIQYSHIKTLPLELVVIESLS